MIEYLSTVKDIVEKVTKFFKENGFTFNEITEVQQGEQRYLKITVSIKIS